MDSYYYYKTCRIAAGYTQEDAAPQLGISLSSLQKYETGKTPVPDDVVIAMGGLYKTTLLVWWHLKYKTPFGPFMPDVQIPQTHGDVGFQTIIARDRLEEATKAIVSILSDGKIDESEYESLWQCIQSFNTVIKGLISSRIYIENHLPEEIVRKTA